MTDNLNPPMPSEPDKAAPANVPRDLLSEMIQEEQVEVDWVFVRQNLNQHITGKFEQEIRLARERLRDVIAAVSPYLITSTKDHPNEQA